MRIEGELRAEPKQQNLDVVSYLSSFATAFATPPSLALSTSCVVLLLFVKNTTSRHNLDLEQWRPRLL